MTERTGPRVAAFALGGCGFCAPGRRLAGPKYGTGSDGGEQVFPICAACSPRPARPLHEPCLSTLVTLQKVFYRNQRGKIPL